MTRLCVLPGDPPRPTEGSPLCELTEASSKTVGFMFSISFLWRRLRRQKTASPIIAVAMTGPTTTPAIQALELDDVFGGLMLGRRFGWAA